LLVLLDLRISLRKVVEEDVLGLHLDSDVDSFGKGTVTLCRS
jgi:hypothetical protein